MSGSGSNIPMISNGKNGFWFRAMEFLSGWRGFLILLAVLLPVKILRAREENSFWVDEIYSVLMAHRSAKELVFLAPQHDNFYFLFLKIWISIGSLFSGLPRLFWARLLNVVFWMIFGVIIWFGGRKLLGKRIGALSAWCILSGAMVAHITKELRSYALPAFALYICFLVFLMILKKSRDNDKPESRSGAVFSLLWMSYAFCALLAVYVQLLSTVLVFYMGIACLFLGIFSKGHKRRIFITGFIIHIIIMILFIPWLLGIKGHLAFVGMNDRRWMSPRTLWNLFRVFIYWFPYGQIPDPYARPLPLQDSSGFGTQRFPYGQSLGLCDRMILPNYILGILSMLLPWLAVLFRMIFFKKSVEKEPPFLKIALMATGLSLLYVGTLFLLHRFAGISIFHAPRYPSLAVPIWTLGLTTAAVWAGRRLKPGMLVIAFLLLPWFLCSVVGQGWVSLWESQGGLSRWKKENPTFFPPKGTPLFVFPKELIPYFPEGLHEYNVKTLDKLAFVPQDIIDVYILDLNNWSWLRTQKQVLLRSLIKNGQLSQETEIKEYSPIFSQFRNYILRDFDHAKAKELLGMASELAAQDIPDTASAIALSENQRINKGWSFLEIDNDRRFFRWATGEKTVIQFPGLLQPGSYVIHLEGFRQPFPCETVEMKFHIKREKQDWLVSQPSGLFHIQLPVKLTHKHRTLNLVVEQPSWEPKEYLQNPKEGRHLSFLFRYGWIEPETSKIP